MNIVCRVLLLGPALLSFYSVFATADGVKIADDLQSKIQAAAMLEMESSSTPSLQIAIGKGQAVIFSQAYGLADIENDVAASVNSKYRTASIAKWFTATAAMKLFTSGALDLDVPIQKYCPEFPVKESPITARQLLTHTAGVRGYYDYEKVISQTKDNTEVERLRLKQLEETASFYKRYIDVIEPLAMFKDDPLLFAPGADWQYSSFGYRVLACVMQGAANMDYSSLMQKLIFEPANMQNTEADDAWKIISGRVAGYQISRGQPLRRANMRDVSENLPAGGYLSTASDLVRFALAYNRFLVPSSVKAQMTNPARSIKLDSDTAKSWRDAIPSADKYGYGVMLFSKYEEGMIGHTGRQDGGSAILILVPKKELAVAIMTNAKGWNGYIDFAIKIKEIVEQGEY